MAQVTQHSPGAQIPLWRSRKLRYVIYQLVFLAAAGSIFYSMFTNALNNLRARGISAGFAFLYNTDSLFVISETLPVPVPEGGFLYFLIALSGGVAGTYLLAKWAASRGRTVYGDPTLVTLALGMLLVLPGLVLYTTGHTIRTVEYVVPSTYGMGLLTGLINTLKLSFFSVILGTVIGVTVGVARLSSNWLVSKLAGVFIEITRNIPLLLQIFFWYFAVLRTLPPVRQSIRMGDYFILNNRGVTLPGLVAEAGSTPLLFALTLSGIIVFYYARYARLRHERTGKQLPVLLPSLGILVLLPALSWWVTGSPFSLSFPELRGFNYFGGLTLTPEFAAMLVSLSLYSGGFIAEIVRSGIQAIPYGQTEAARAIGLSRARVLRLVILPQARRVIIPPLTATWLGTIKDSSLGVAVGYPELVSVGGTILDVSGQVMEVIGLTILFYMATTLLVSLLMNWYNAKVRLRRR